MKEMNRLALLIVAVALLATSVPAHVFATETDERVESAAKKSYVFQTYLKDDAISIKSQDGNVTLTGTVTEESHKSLAQETVSSLPGVTGVDNRLEANGERAPENSDAWIAMNVKASLLFHRNLSTSKTDVQVKDGVVTLHGEAASPAQMDLATEYVKDVEGVKGVQNEMTVSKTPRNPAEKTMGEKMGDMGESIDDASITALVKMTLMYHRSTSAVHTTVETNKGVVTLGGKAKNASEKDLVTKIVKDVNGVKGVKNRMTIE